MFTGIIEAIGELLEKDDSSSGGGGCSMTISEAESILDDVHLGDSIAINGTCLTVTAFGEGSFKVGISPETLRRTDLGELKRGSKVNLERAVGADVRFGGHFLQGHVDTTATIRSRSLDGNSIRFQFAPADPSLLKYIVEKGYIGIDGTSLTVTEVDDAEGYFGVMVIAYTQERVILPRKQVGEKVNIEVDMIGKYVEKQVAAHLVGLQKEQGVLEAMIERIVDRKLQR